MQATLQCYLLRNSRMLISCNTFFCSTTPDNTMLADVHASEENAYPMQDHAVCIAILQCYLF